MERYEIKNYPNYRPKIKKIFKSKIAKALGYKIYLVDGIYARNNINIDFLAGYNPVDPYIPKGEIWIDRNIPKKEQKDYIMHELIEAVLINTYGENYDKAHYIASEIEKVIRK